MNEVNEMENLEKKIKELEDEVRFAHERISKLSVRITDNDLFAEGLDEFMDKVKEKLKKYSASKVSKITIEQGFIEIILFEEENK